MYYTFKMFVKGTAGYAMLSLLLILMVQGTSFAQYPPQSLSYEISNQRNVEIKWNEGYGADAYLLSFDDGTAESWKNLFGATGEQYFANKFIVPESGQLNTIKILVKPTISGVQTIELGVLGDESGVPVNASPLVTTTVEFTGVSQEPQLLTASVDYSVTKDQIIYLYCRWNEGDEYVVGVDKSDPDELTYYTFDDEYWNVFWSDDAIINGVVNTATTKTVASLEGYNVYKDGVKMNTELLSIAKYSEENLEDGNYQYTASAVYDGVETEQSTPLNIEIKYINYDLDFETGEIPEEWVVYDLDENNKKWEASYATGGHETHNGEFYGIVGYNGEGNNDWLITPYLMSTDEKSSFSLFAASGDSDYPESFKVLLSTGGVEVADFTVELADEQNISGEWTEYTYDLSAYKGQKIHVAIVSYTVDGGDMLIDDILAPIYSESRDLMVVSLKGDALPVNGKASAYEVTVRNHGNVQEDTYQVNLIDKSGTIVASASGVAVEPEEDVTVFVNWTPAVVGLDTLHAQVVLVGDGIPDNDNSGDFDISVQEDYMGTATLGEKDNVTGFVPIDFTNNNSVTQVIYYPEEIVIGGELTALSWYSNATGDLPDRHIKIWVCETDLPNLDGGFIPVDNFTPVYDGNISVSEGQHMVSVQFDDAFIYHKRNLVVMVQKDETTLGDKVYEFYNTVISGQYHRSRFAFSDEAIDINNLPEGADLHRFSDVTFCFDQRNVCDLSGNIKDAAGEPLADVKITVGEAHYVVNTDEQGAYMLVSCAVNETSCVATLFGYQDNSKDLTLVAGQNNVLDFVMAPLPQVKVSGKVLTKDGDAIAGASVSLAGYKSYSAVTDDNGQYEFAAVYGLKNYTIEVFSQGYQSYESTVDVENGELELDDIELAEMNIAPGMVTASLESAELIKVNWVAPGFESGYAQDFEALDDFTLDLSPMTTIDGDGYKTGNFQIIGFPHRYEPMAFMVFNCLTTTPPIPEGNLAHSGEKMAVSFFPYDPEQSPSTVQNDDWMITPMVNIQSGFRLNFFARTFKKYDNLERFTVLVSTTDTNPESFTKISEGEFIEAPEGEWGEFSYDLNDYAGENIYVAIHCVSYDVQMFMVDDITINNPDAEKMAKAVKAYEIYRFKKADQGTPSLWVKVGTVNETQFDDDNLSSLVEDETYQYAVVAVYPGDVKSDAVFSNDILYTHVGLQDENQGLSLYPNPATGFINLVIEEQAMVTLTDISGRMIGQWNLPAGNRQLNVNSYHGMGLFRIEIKNSVVNRKVLFN